MVTIESPRLTGENPTQQLKQLQSYLTKTAQQLQWAFDTLEKGAPRPAAPVPQPQKPSESFSPQAVFGGIKNLIIKSAEIVDAYGAQIQRRLDGVYTAKSQFGTFQEATAQSLEANSESLKQLFTRHQEIRNSVDGLWDRALDTESYLKTGLLGEDRTGGSIYGLEVGQKSMVDGKPVFDRFARFTANRLSFFDSADVEVAYISDYKLCITNAEISGSLYMGGRFRIYSSGGLIFQWTGGNANGPTL